MQKLQCRNIEVDAGSTLTYLPAPKVTLVRGNHFEVLRCCFLLLIDQGGSTHIDSLQLASNILSLAC